MSGADAPPGVPRILAMVSQSGGLGDVLIASLFLRALRRWRPDARIDLFCGPQGAPAARLLGLRSPLVGRPWPGPLDLLADAWRLRREGRFDEVYSLSEVRSTIWLARAARARRTAGYDWEGRGRGLDLRLPWRPEANLALRHLELLREV
ncbi:MAG: hypothetical protein HY608_07385, partial [Planctomycetes bacterium]|nr:hypothetical protein [Planctomycetota bacterium]